MSLPASFYAKGVNEWDEPADDDCTHFQEYRADVLRGFARIDEIPPAIGCVHELKFARDLLASLTRTAGRAA
jgi:hypothetical protein